MHNGDGNTKFGFPSNDTFKIRTSGVDRLNINSSGNVGIGTTNPSNKLVISGNDTNSDLNGTTVTDAALQLSNSDEAYGTFFGTLGTGTGLIQQRRRTSAVYYNLGINPYGGNVGIGTTSPGAPLSVVGSYSSSDEIVEIGGGTGINTDFKLKIGAVDQDYIWFQSVKPGDNYYDLVFNPTAGNVGIGTTTPTAKLHVAGTGLFTGLVSGITPVAAANFVTKAYVDGSGGGTGPFLPLAGGTMTGTNGVLMPDNFRLKIGTSEDLLIFHDGTDSQIFNQAGDLKIRNDQNDGDIVFMSDNGSGGTTEYFRVDGGITKTVFVRDTKHLDSKKALFGDQDDLQIYHDGSNSYIQDSGSGNLRILVGDMQIRNYGTNENIITSTANAEVALYYNASEKLATTSTGIDVTGDIQIDSALLSNQENTDVDTGTETVASVAIATYTAAFFDFVIKKTTNVRSGTVYACHDGTTVQFTETSTQDLGDTSDVTLSVDISGTNMRLLATVTSDDWSVKSLIRAI